MNLYREDEHILIIYNWSQVSGSHLQFCINDKSIFNSGNNPKKINWHSLNNKKKELSISSKEHTQEQEF